MATSTTKKTYPEGFEFDGKYHREGDKDYKKAKKEMEDYKKKISKVFHDVPEIYEDEEPPRMNKKSNLSPKIKGTKAKVKTAPPKTRPLNHKVVIFHPSKKTASIKTTKAKKAR